MDNFRVEQKLRDGWKTISEDTRGEYRGPNANLPPVAEPSPQKLPYTQAPRGERVGSSEPEPAGVNLTPAEKTAVFAMLRAAVAQMQMDGAVGTVSEISPDLESAMMKLR